MRYLKFFKWLIILLILLSALGTLSAKPQPVLFTFERSMEGWTSIPLPGGVETTLLLVDESSGKDGKKRSLQAEYTTQSGKMAGFIRPVDGLKGNGLRVRLKTATAATLVLGFVERDGSTYMHVIQTLPNKWLLVEVQFTTFSISSDSTDENGRLDLDQIAVLIVADASGFAPQQAVKQTLSMDEYNASAKLVPPKPQAYRPLLETGIPSTSGGRVTTGISYPIGKFGQGMLANSSGELAAIPLKFKPTAEGGWNWENGTIEMWICPQFDMAQVQDYSGILVMQDEPFMAGLRGSLQIFYTGSRQIAFILNTSMDSLVASPVLDWKKGEWHHIATSWGKNGMRFYLDGKLAAHKSTSVGPCILSSDVVVGNNAWTIVSNKVSNTVIDELRVSKRQRSDQEISVTARAILPLKSDIDTLALEHFDGNPLPPIRLKQGASAFNVMYTGKPVKLIADSPGKIVCNSILSYTIFTPGGSIVRKGEIKITESKLGNKDIPVILRPFEESGFYRVAFRLESSKRVINQGGDWFRVTNPSPAPIQSSLLFGASGCYSDFTPGEAFFKYAAAAGVRSLRTPFEWAEIEPQEGKFIWEKYDRIVRWANTHYVELIPTFIWEKPQPAWAGRGNIKKGLEEEHYPPEDMVKWSEFVYQVVNRYKESIHWWIPANEPNLSKYWHPKSNAKAYTELLKATWTATRKADPQAKILGCSVSGMDLVFLEECFKEGALEYSDAIGVHPYICPHSPDELIPINILNPNSQPGTFYDGLVSAKTLIHKYGGKQKLWLDEAGQPYRDDFLATNWGVEEPKAAEYLTKIFLESMASGAVDRVMWFSFWGGEYGSFGLLKPDSTPTLLMAAYIAASDRLSYAEFIKQGNRGVGVRSLIFKIGNRQIEVIWNPNKKTNIELQQGEKAFDIYGFSIQQTKTGRKLKLSTQPIYLEKDGE